MKITWNPDAVAPPLGDVYEREQRAGNLLKYLAGAALLVALAASALWLKL